ncbi:hypothetical protein W04_3170 [Pseudoalteromonas sp. SW0106-04]|nr:hypothetical protein W04_3170 [Pseudoalteromonas sp. SW0106-04]
MLSDEGAQAKRFYAHFLRRLLGAPMLIILTTHLLMKVCLANMFGQCQIHIKQEPYAACANTCPVTAI